MVCLLIGGTGAGKTHAKHFFLEWGPPLVVRPVQAIEQQIANPGSDGAVCQIAGTCDFSTTGNGSLSARVNMILKFHYLNSCKKLKTSLILITT